MTALEIDNPFWQFSLRVYAAPGVAEECLEVQERLGINVNVLLYAAWLGAARGIILQDAELRMIDDAVEGWTAEVVQPLRAVRRRLKVMPQIEDPAVQAVRKQVTQAELSAEQIQQAMLYRLTDDLGRSSAGSNAAARGNVMAILASTNAGASAFPMQRLLTAASEACST